MNRDIHEIGETLKNWISGTDALPGRRTPDRCCVPGLQGCSGSLASRISGMQDSRISDFALSRPRIAGKPARPASRIPSRFQTFSEKRALFSISHLHLLSNSGAYHLRLPIYANVREIPSSARRSARHCVIGHRDHDVTTYCYGDFGDSGKSFFSTTLVVGYFRDVHFCDKAPGPNNPVPDSER